MSSMTLQLGFCILEITKSDKNFLFVWFHTSTEPGIVKLVIIRVIWINRVLFPIQVNTLAPASSHLGLRFSDQNIICIPESFDTNFSHQLFGYLETLVKVILHLKTSFIRLFQRFLVNKKKYSDLV